MTPFELCKTKTEFILLIIFFSGIIYTGLAYLIPNPLLVKTIGYLSIAISGLSYGIIKYINKKYNIEV